MLSNPDRIDEGRHQGKIEFQSYQDDLNKIDEIYFYMKIEYRVLELCFGLS